MVAVVLRLRKHAIKVYDISCNKQKKRDNYTLSSCVRASAAACLNRYYNMWLVMGHFTIPKWTKALLISLTHLLWTNPPLFCQCALDRAFLSSVLGLTRNAIIWSLTYKMWVVQQENPHSTSATHNSHGANQWWRYQPPAPCPRWRSFYAVFCTPPSSARVKSWRSHQWTWRSIWRFPSPLSCLPGFSGWWRYAGTQGPQSQHIFEDDFAKEEVVGQGHRQFQHLLWGEYTFSSLLYNHSYDFCSHTSRLSMLKSIWLFIMSSLWRTRSC